MTQVPEPFMGRDQRLPHTPALDGHSDIAAGEDATGDRQQFVGGRKIALVAGAVKGRQNLVAETPTRSNRRRLFHGRRPHDKGIVIRNRISHQ